MHPHTQHAERPPAGRTGRATRPSLLATVSGPTEIAGALAAGANGIDVTGWDAATLAAARAGHPAAWLVPAPPGTADADALATAAGDGADATIATVVAVAAVVTWVGAPAIRTRHVWPVRRAIDMASVIGGTQPPALTLRALA